MSWVPPKFIETVSRNGKGISRISPQDVLFKVGESTHLDFLLPFLNQRVFQNIQSHSGVFLSLDLWKAVRDAGKAGAPLSYHDWGRGDGGLCVGERAHPLHAICKAAAGGLRVKSEQSSCAPPSGLHQPLRASGLMTQPLSSPT